MLRVKYLWDFHGDCLKPRTRSPGPGPGSVATGGSPGRSPFAAVTWRPPREENYESMKRYVCFNGLT